MLGFVEGLTPLIMTPLVTILYNNTLNTNPSVVYYYRKIHTDYFVEFFIILNFFIETKLTQDGRSYLCRYAMGHGKPP